ncbi:SRP40, C-terminal domain-containing protein, partial [Phyllosticta paracitricarpa]
SPDASDDGPSNSAKRARKAAAQNEPFSRIPKDQYVDPKFASNKYVPYDYANAAHERLIVTRGKGFTKEKNKGKRGSYRGGQIDTNAFNGIRFED